MLDFDPKNTMHYVDIWKDASNTTILYLVNVLVYYKTVQGTFPSFISPGYYPLALFAYMHIKVVWPSRHQTKSKLLPMAKILFQVIGAPFCATNFIHSVVGDYLSR
jgi:hypothetical protein